MIKEASLHFRSAHIVKSMRLGDTPQILEISGAALQSEQNTLPMISSVFWS